MDEIDEAAVEVVGSMLQDDDIQVYLAPFQNSVLHPSHVRVFLIVSYRLITCVFK